METELLERLFIPEQESSYRTYEEWKLSMVLHQRMQGRVLTVPMRNGNMGKYAIPKSHVLSSYRTYEEWKLLKMTRNIRGLTSSYRTYEEWKLL
mgnify:CR=1 FL=1